MESMCESGGQIKAGSGGAVSVLGFGGATTGGSNLGVFVTGAGSQITSAGGSIAVSGQGGGSGASANNYGVDIQSGGQITSGGSGTLVVQGTGGATTGGVDIGVFISDANSQVTSSGGSVTVVGQGGGSGASATNHGVNVQVAGQISAGGSGTVTVQGTAGNTTGGSDIGVLVTQGSSQITSSGGAVMVTGQGSGGSDGIQVGPTAKISTANNADLTLVGDRIEFDTTSSHVSAGTGTVNLKPQTAGLAINLGDSNSSTQLGFTGAEFTRITAGTINFGDTLAYTGAVTISSATTVASQLAVSVARFRDFYAGR